MDKILISPGKYIQGKGTLAELSKHVGHLGKNFFVLISENGYKRFGETIKSSFNHNINFEIFNGECSRNEIERVRAIVKDKSADVIIGVGGGKIHDTAKAVAHYEELPVVIVATVASTDAPTSALSVIYTDEGVFSEYLNLPKNPDVVLLDVDAVVKAPVRLLVAGMGDALATKFETRAAIKSGATTMAGGVQTATAEALANLAYDILMEEGYKAKLAAEAGVATKSVEKVIEANTLLSGIGFESGGLSASHAIHDGFTTLEETGKLYHGELVAFGVISQLVLENASMEELEEVIYFCKDVGLPTTLEEINLKDVSEEDLRSVADIVAAEGSLAHNLPFKVTADDIYAAILGADALGRAL